MVIFATVCCHGNSLQYTHMNENGIPGVFLIFTVIARSLNPKLRQILHFQFVILFQVQILLKLVLQGATLRYWGSDNSSIQFPELEKKGQKRSLEPKDQLVLTLARLRVNIAEKILADNYKISVGKVSRIHFTRLDLIYSRLGQLPALTSKNTIQKTMPESFREKLPINQNNR